MFAKLREVFVREYIGAILIALLVWQGGVEIITRIARIVYWRLYTHQSVVTPSESFFRWDGLIFSLVSAVLYLLTACLLFRWLYGRGASPSLEEPEIASEQPR